MMNDVLKFEGNKFETLFKIAFQKLDLQQEMDLKFVSQKPIGI